MIHNAYTYARMGVWARAGAHARDARERVFYIGISSGEINIRLSH